MKQTIDCRGLACPLPVVNAKKAAAQFTEDGTLTVQVDNEIAVQNLMRFAKKKGFAAESETTGEDSFTVTMQVKAEEGVTASPQTAQAAKALPEGGKTVVLNTHCMGTSDENLGKRLIKTFLFALASQDEIPARIIFYNTGIYLTCEGSESLEDLRHLEEAGATIYTCGTCLEYFQMKDKLRIGEVSNMHEIVEMLLQSSLVVSP